MADCLCEQVLKKNWVVVANASFLSLIVNEVITIDNQS
jgi:hypothetical protein